MPVILKNGTAQVRKSSSGALVRSFGNGRLVGADVSESLDLIVLTYDSGKVEVRSISTGSLKRSFPNSYQSACFSGEDVLLNLKRGGAELRRLSSGALIRKFS